MGIERGMVGSGGTGDDVGGETETVFSFLQLLSLTALPAAAPVYILGSFPIP